MRSSFRHSPDRMFVLIVFILFINLLTSGDITWSRWPMLGLAFVYFMLYFGDSGGEQKDQILLKERYAKGELSEEEFLNAKERIKEEFAERANPAVRYFIGFFLIAVAVIYILRNYLGLFIPIPWIPVLLIAIGLFAIFRGRG